MTLPNIDINPDKIETLEEAKEVIVKLLNLIEQLSSQMTELFNQVQELKAENDRLKKQAGKPTFKEATSGKRYSSEGHLPEGEKHGKTSKQIFVDRHLQLPEVSACDCGSQEFVLIRTWNKLVQGLIIKRDNVVYHGRDKRCKRCGKLHKSVLPEGMNGYQFSSELRSWLSVFKYDCRMSETVVSRFLLGLGVQISSGHINHIILDNSSKLTKGYTHLKVWGLKLSKYLHSDATGLTRQVMTTGKRLKQHLHFLGHQTLSLFKITAKYNSVILATKVLGKRAMKAIYISDDGSPNGENLSIKEKQLCWIHEIRHFLKLEPKVKAHASQLESVIGQLWQFYETAKHYGRDPTSKKRQELEELFDRITNQASEYTKLANRLKLTKRKRTRLLCFLDHPGIPIENNLAERDIRPAVIIRKSSGGTKSEAGDRSFERHLSIIQTAHKQGLNIFDTIHGLLMGTLDPFVLTGKTLPALTAS